MSRSVRLLVSHHNRLFRECLVSVLSDVPNFVVGYVDHTDAEYLKTMDAVPPNVILVGMNLPDKKAIDLIRHVRQHLETTKILLLARGNSEDNLYECFSAGIHGCVMEEASLEDLQNAIQTVLRGEAFCSPQLVYTMFQRLTETAHESRWRGAVRSLELTPRELEIVHLIAEKMSNKEIARQLHLSLYTVKNHVHNIVEKLQVQDRFEAVAYARKRGWLDAGTGRAFISAGR